MAKRTLKMHNERTARYYYVYYYNNKKNMIWVI